MPKKIDITPNILINSPLAKRAKKLRDVRNQILPVNRIVVHIVGTGTYIRAMIAKQPPLDRVEAYFDNRGVPFAHYTIDPWGRIRQHAEEIERPWSQGWGGLGGRKKLLADLKSGKRKLPDWWKDGHAGWTAGGDDEAMQDLFQEDTPNDRSISIEFLQWQPGKIVRKKYVGMRNYKLTMAQYLIGNLLARDIAIRHGKILPESDMDRACINEGWMQVLGHEDCDPWGRGKPKTGGWDPGALRPKGKRFCWDCFLGLYFNSCNCGCVIPTPPMPDWAK
jgi:hypothetical protein